MSKKKDGKKRKSGKKKDLESILPGDLAHAVTQAARSMRTALSRSLAESGLYAGQDGVILALAEEDGLTAGQLATLLGVKAPTMTRTIGRMEAQGFVERRDDGADGRLTKVFLAPSGRANVERIGQSVTECSTRAFGDFSEKEVRTLLRLLKAMDSNLQGVAETESVDVAPSV
ncbi:MarR family winged helix-turn-helix transcriptional regulator [Neorhizobium sp. T786]|uniref:MarR family winged helix-turn-helix transcriptional regulator n=1 Tax=Pseudorhizobium xiangyangii TaxID=2883104 RepID=UPI001CFF676E|nr:MarR family winged helix-turn-helix transcriptional regulator [Neorhizobium xiangyangii]MCB5204314.1 MarR family winged helix-turn-helix transcriptional regulator [Neorhizobium xiangyangii]